MEVDRLDSIAFTFGEHREGVGLVADEHGGGDLGDELGMVLSAAVSDHSGIGCNVGAELGNELHFREAW